MGSGTDVAMETGGIVIIKNDLRDVVSSIDLSRSTMSKIKQNMFFALFYNVIGIPIAARVFSFAGLVLKPELAGLAMALSSISVVGNSLILRRFTPGKKDYVSTLAPAFMAIAFTFMFIQFANVSSSMASGEKNMQTENTATMAVLAEKLLQKGNTKLVIKDGETKVFLEVSDIGALKIAQGSYPQRIGDIILGAEEAEMMKKARIFQNVGDEIYGIFGLPRARIVGILAMTDTELDNYHIADKKTFKSIAGIEYKKSAK